MRYQVLADPAFAELREAGPARFPLLPLEAAESSPNPRSQGGKHRRRLAEPELAAPSRQVATNIGDHPVQVDTPVPFREFPNSLLEPQERFRRYAPFRLLAAGEAKPQKLPLRWSSYGAFRLVDLELELAGDETRDALHHTFAGAATAEVDVTVVGVPHKAETASLKFLVQVIQHEVAQQRRNRTPLWSPFFRRTHQPVLHDLGVQERPKEFEHAFVFHSLGNASHQHGVIDSVEKLLQINIDGAAVTFGDVRLGLGHCLMSTAPRTEAIALLGERLLPTPLKDLKDCLLEEAVECLWDTELAHASVVLRNLDAFHWLGSVGSREQLFSDLGPATFHVLRQLADGHPINRRIRVGDRSGLRSRVGRAVPNDALLLRCPLLTSVPRSVHLTAHPVPKTRKDLPG